MAITLRRYAVVQLLLLWQGGFLFYAACVVPAGTQLLGAAGQGAITARVTDALNLIGVAGVGVFALELGLTRDPNPRRTARRWWAWGVAMLSQLLLLYLHVLLDAFMDPDRRRVVIGVAFYPVHRVYLWASTVQWLACLLLTWWTLRAWREEDLANSGRSHSGPNPKPVLIEFQNPDGAGSSGACSPASTAPA